MSAVFFLWFIAAGFSSELIFGKRSPEQNALYALVVILAASIALLVEGGAA